MKKETIVILILAVLLVASAAALVIQRQRYNALLAAYQEAEAKSRNQGNTIGGSVGRLVDTIIKLFVIPM